LNASAKASLVILTGALLSAGPALRADSLLLRGGKVWTISGEVIESGDVLVTDGKIASVGRSVSAPDGARVIDVSGKSVCPGFVDAHSHLGLPANELDERVTPVAPDTRILDAFWSQREDVRRAASSGVTTLLLAPGPSNPIAGPCTAVKLGHTPVLKRDAALKILLAESALLWDRKPTSMPGLLQMVREHLTKTRGNAETPVQVVCDGVSEAERALELIDEFGLQGSIAMSVGSSRLADLLGGTGIPVIVRPLIATPRDKHLTALSTLATAGVKLAFSSMAPATDESDLRTSAALAVGAGLSEDAALRALTLSPAEIIGVADRVGSIEAGKDADLLVIDGDPLNISAPIELVVIDGDIIYEREAK